MQLVKSVWRRIDHLGRSAWRWFRSAHSSGLPPDFDEQTYLDLNPDVRQAVNAGGLASGASHYMAWGVGENRNYTVRSMTKEQVDEFRRLVDLSEQAQGAARQELAAALTRLDRLEEQSRLLDLKCHTERILTLESQYLLERDRIDWALGLAEGLSAERQAYQKERQNRSYWAAYEVSEPLISVCIATLDRASLLVERSLKSVLAQSYKNLQIIIVGDNCMDDTERRLAQIGDSRCSFVNLPERGPYPPPGLDRWRVAGTNAMNHALGRCEGDFITHLDDDDAMTPDRIETLLQAAQAKKADFLWHSFRYERPDGEWQTLGDGDFAVGQVTTGSVFYHRYFARIPWDVNAYRISEPGDWNRFRKIKFLRPRLHFVNSPLLLHYSERSQPVFSQRENERFLDD